MTCSPVPCPGWSHHTPTTSAGTTGTGDIMPVTNTLENLHREFRRRTKTQASFGTENAALIILYGLVAFGRIQPRKIDGHQQLSSFIAKEWKKVA